MEKKFDTMADHVRRFAYSQMMMEPSASQILATTWGLYNRPVVPEWQIFLLKVCMPVLKPFMMKVRVQSKKQSMDSISWCPRF